MVLFLLPWACLIGTFLCLAGRQDRNGNPASDLHAAYLAAVILWGALLVAITEGLSLFAAITRPWLALAWGSVLGGLILVGWRKGTIPRGWRKLRTSWSGITTLERILLGGVSILCLSLLLVAFISPPNNVDSMVYHMGRVVNWAQNHGLRHYATMNFGQILKPIWAEAAILNLRVLWGSDRPANLVQWFSMLAGLVGVSGLAKLLGADRKGQLLAAAFAVSIPMGVLQATSTQNDYAVAMWVVCLTYFVVRSKSNPSSAFHITLIGLSLGLGMLTKGTFYAYAFPILLWFFLPRLWRVGILRTIAQGLVVGLLAVVLNLGFWGRNVATYGGPFGPSGGLPLVFREMLPRQEPNAAGPTSIPLEPPDVQGPVAGTATTTPGPGASNTSQPPAALGAWDVLSSRSLWFLRRLAQNMGQNTVMPTHFLTSTAWGLMLRLPWLFDPDFVRSLAEGMWNHEDTAGSLLHLLLGLTAILALLVLTIRRREMRLAALCGLVAFASYAMLTLISYSVDLFGVRYQLSFFVMCAPLVGVAATALTRKAWPTTLLTIALLAYAVPYLLLNNTRPILGWRPKTRIESVFIAPQVDILYAMAAGFQDEDAAVASQILESGCTDVGLKIDYNGFDYPWWWLLRAPQSGVRIDNLTTYPPLEMYADPAFQPCAIICTICAGRQEVEGLPLVVDYGHVQLFGALETHPGP